MTIQYVGIDISLATATVAWHQVGDKHPTVVEIEQTPQAYEKLTQQLNRLAQPENIHIVMEATSTYWMDLAYYLAARNFQLSVINPAQAKYFAKLQLRQAKTDAIDAVLLMEFAQSQKPALWTTPPAICERLRQYLTYRQQLIDMQTQVRNQYHAFQHNPQAETDLLERMRLRLAALSDEIQELAQRIHTLLLSEHDWSDAVRYLLSIPGIHTLSTAWILVATHCFARCDSPEQAASFAGLAPHPRDSGSSKRGYRTIGGAGHQPLRNTLYMASAAAARFNPLLKSYYDSLVQRGKAKKVARCAVARKLLHMAWACVTKKRFFDPNFQAIAQAT